MEDQINEKMFGQLLCLPQTSLLVDVKDLGYDNGALATMDLVHQFQVSSHFTLCTVSLMPASHTLKKLVPET